jgi:protease I
MNDSAKSIANKRVALLVEQEFDDGELFGPLEALRTAGADVAVVGATAPTEYRGMQGGEITSTISVGRARVEDFDAIVIPGGWAPGRMRMRHAMVDLIRDAVAHAKPVAAICHGPQMLISAKVVQNRVITCWPSIAIDIKNAGGLYVDKPVAVDGNVITSRKLADVADFSEAIIRALSDVTTDSN